MSWTKLGLAVRRTHARRQEATPEECLSQQRTRPHLVRQHEGTKEPQTPQRAHLPSSPPSCKVCVECTTSLPQGPHLPSNSQSIPGTVYQDSLPTTLLEMRSNAQLSRRSILVGSISYPE